MSYNFIGKTKASDSYRYLSAFLKWIGSSTFHPLFTNDVVVTVDVEAVHDGARVECCEVCQEKLARMGVVAAIRALNWEGLVTVDLEKIVSRNGAFLCKR